jgi:hypothetical protein
MPYHVVDHDVNHEVHTPVMQRGGQCDQVVSATVLGIDCVTGRL